MNYPADCGGVVCKKQNDMNIKTVLHKIVLLLLIRSFFSCGKDDIDFSNIENLYEKRLHVL